MTRTQANSTARGTGTAGAVLQRKCACGTHTAGGETCPKCAAEERTGLLQRSAIWGGEVGAVPAIVYDVLREPGQPLDAASRAYFEPRFGADFGDVRIHTGPKAAASAATVAAEAYTVGRDLVFAAGTFDTTNLRGQRLLAHELMHAAQHGPGAGDTGGLQLGRDDDPQEAEARRAADLIGTTPAAGLAPGDPTLQRQPADTGEVIPGTGDVRPATSEIEQMAKKYGVDLPKVGSKNHAGRALTEAERTRIEQLVRGGAAGGATHSFTRGPQFVLHDTAARPAGKNEAERQKKEAAKLAEHQRESRGPLDEGAAAYVPRQGAGVIARPDFYDPRRPTATEYERRADLISQANREAAFEAVWAATKASEQQAALGASLAGLEEVAKPGETKKQTTARAVQDRKMTPGEVAAEQGKAQRELEAPLPAKPKKSDKPHIHTTGAWTVAAVCKKLKTVPAAQLADTPADAKAIEDGCRKLGPYFAEQDPRLGSMVNVEIVQEKEPPCSIDPKTPAASIPKLPSPAYTPDQYHSLVVLYLEAALQAGRFPEITTHFWVDRSAGDHCDPRCFDLPHLYELIAAQLGHAKGSTYGIAPHYGTTQGTDNLWWHNVACGGSHP